MSLLASSQKASRRTFDKWSSWYGDSPIVNRFLSRWDREVLQMKLPTPILDLGCATGRLVNKLICDGYDDVFGVDLSFNCLRVAREKRVGALPQLCQGLVEQLCYSAESFGSAVLSGVIHHIEKPEKALIEIAGVLRKSGKLVVAEPYFPIVIRHMVNLVLEIYPVAGDRRFYTPSGIEELASATGFRKLCAIDLPLGFMLVFERC